MRAYIAVPASGVYPYTGTTVRVGEVLVSAYFRTNGISPTDFHVFRDQKTALGVLTSAEQATASLYELEVADDQVTVPFVVALMVTAARVLREILPP